MVQAAGQLGVSDQGSGSSKHPPTTKEPAGKVRGYGSAGKRKCRLGRS